jgi:hypothetical protein
MRGYDAGQFGPFDGLDNRKALMGLMVRLGEGLTEAEAGKRRARVLRSLLGDSRTAFKNLAVNITPCGAVEAYHLFTAITGCLGVPVETAARRLEEVIRRQ